MKRQYVMLLTFLLLASSALAQGSSELPRQDAGTQTQNAASPLNYVLGPRDQVSVWARDLDEVTKSAYQVEPTGFVSVPLLGRVKAEGLTLEQFENELRDRAKTYVVQPDIVVNVVAYRTISVSVLGSVLQPGVKVFDRGKSLLEAISAAGGVSATAGFKAKVSRRIDQGPLPLPNVVTDPTGRYYTAEVSLKSILEGTSAENIVMQPDDVVTIPKGDVVYVLGEVRTPGGISPDDEGRISILQALSRVGGVGPNAKPKHAKLFRPIAGLGKQAEFDVDVESILRGGQSEVQMLANDILVIPAAKGRAAAQRILQTAIQAGTQILTFGVLRSAVNNRTTVSVP